MFRCPTSAAHSCSSSSRRRLPRRSRVASSFGWRMERRRRQGKNLRYRAGPRRGPAGQAFARKLEDHRELGLRVLGFLDDSSDVRAAEPVGVPRPARRPRGRAAHAGHRRGRDLPPVLAVEPDRRDRAPVRGGGQDRPDPDGRPRPRRHRRSDGGTRRDAGLLARLGSGSRARPRGQASGRPRCVVRCGSRAAEPVPARRSPLRSGSATAVRCSSGSAASASTVGSSTSSSSDRCGRRRGSASPTSRISTRSRAVRSR